MCVAACPLGSPIARLLGASRQWALASQQATDLRKACPFALSPLAPSGCALISEYSPDLPRLEASTSPLLTVTVPAGRGAAESLHESPRPVKNDDALDQVSFKVQFDVASHTDAPARSILA